MYIIYRSLGVKHGKRYRSDDRFCCRHKFEHFRTRFARHVSKGFQGNFSNFLNRFAASSLLTWTLALWVNFKERNCWPSMHETDFRSTRHVKRFDVDVSSWKFSSLKFQLVVKFSCEPLFTFPAIHVISPVTRHLLPGRILRIYIYRRFHTTLASLMGKNTMTGR